MRHRAIGSAVRRRQPPKSPNTNWAIADHIVAFPASNKRENNKRGQSYGKPVRVDPGCWKSLRGHRWLQPKTGGGATVPEVRPRTKEKYDAPIPTQAAGMPLEVPRRTIDTGANQPEEEGTKKPYSPPGAVATEVPLRTTAARAHLKANGVRRSLAQRLGPEVPGTCQGHGWR